MTHLGKRTITTLEIAEMMEAPHKDILKKLEGARGRKGYLQILTERQMSPSEFFLESTYKDGSGKENKCYEVTKLGCDFLANKFTGEKGIIFTAKYVKKFEEMENQIMKAVTPIDHPREVANLIRSVSKLMKNQGSAPHEITQNAKLLCEQYGITLIKDFVKIPEFQQISLMDC